MTQPSVFWEGEEGKQHKSLPCLMIQSSPGEGDPYGRTQSWLSESQPMSPHSYQKTLIASSGINLNSGSSQIESKKPKPKP